MTIYRGTAHYGSITREVTWNSSTKHSERYSQSAGGWVDNGNRRSLRDAIEAAVRDIARGQRNRGDMRKRS